MSECLNHNRNLNDTCCHHWNILFNSDESFARLSLTSLDGRQCYAKTLTNVHRGQEEIVSFSGLTRGVYILNVKTRNSNASRKVMVD